MVSSIGLRQHIRNYIQRQLEAKLEKLKPDEIDKIQAVKARHQWDAWLEDVATRAAKLQLVTHAVKFTHSKIRKATSILYEAGPEQVAEPQLVGTHSLGEARTPDVVGNAAYLDTFKFLRESWEGRTLLQRARESDPVLIAALSDDEARSRAWVESMAAIADSDLPPTSSTLTKQLYFPLDGGGYHLLAPLFPTSLVHALRQSMAQDRYGEQARAANEARRQKQPHDGELREYPNLMIQSFGGTKPQNVSQLNSERGGDHWLLPSLPPIWKSRQIYWPRWDQSVFKRFFPNRREVERLTRVLRAYLVEHAGPRHNNIEIRATRAAMVQAIVDELLLFTAELQSLPAGWSDDPDCRLDAIETYWLDPYRGELDPEFDEKRRRRDWQEEVCGRFGNWLNNALKHDKLPMGKEEQVEWKGLLDKEFALLKEGLIHVG